jgi:hypothetical protein
LRVGAAYRKQIIIKDAHNLQWINIIECIRADGAIYSSLMILLENTFNNSGFRILVIAGGMIDILLYYLRVKRIMKSQFSG